ncbi:MAG: aldo/keto reductase [Brachybacterium sp.]|nr:aldo/keto reductase [Brachybacterium sp.]MDN5899698.1 aldo/keto reductase [Brachybacterium sp.]
MPYRTDEIAEDVVGQAIGAGYRHIDTAAGYQNEGGVGRAVKASGTPREDLFITTKPANGDQGSDAAKDALETSLDTLEMEHVDLYLIHWASPQRGTHLESWKALIELQEQGKAKSIGVSNFAAADLELTGEEIEKINGLDSADGRIGPDPADPGF